MKRLLIAYFLFSIPYLTTAQSSEYKCYPASWWVGMKWNTVQVMVHGDKVADKFPFIKKGAKGIKLATGVNLVKINRVENPNYIFLDLVIDKTAKPGSFSFPFLKNIQLQYELKARRPGNGTLFAQGVTSKDLIYLIMPDRFSNGDTANDRVAGMRDQSLDRSNIAARHGGDLQGVENHLDYLQDLGVTTLWLNPVIENDMPNRTEHGYAFTDHYTIEPRIGGEKAYNDLVAATHKKGMKLIQDAVYNHVGSYHFTVTDIPMKSWLNQWPQFTNTSFKDQVVFDPHASEMDKRKMTDGWFKRDMPDLNQRNPYVARFLIQHAIWTVEEFGIDGWRIDTYAYNDLDFMNRCNQALINEYPRLTMFGETWVHGVPNQSYFVQNNYNIPFKSNLQASTDFQTLWAITETMTRDFGWDDGVNKLYTTLAQDFVYKDPTRQVIFLDNHDMARFYSVVGEDVLKYQSSLTWLLTSRGIPEIYYGDELATTGTTQPSDGYVRLDFPGGWPGDKVNKFLSEGRTKKDDSIFHHISVLANFRKQSTALTTGKLMQYVPEEGVYVYFRYDSNETIMVVINTNKTVMRVSPAKYPERTAGFNKMKNIFTGEINNLREFSVAAKSSGVYKLLI